MKIGVSLRDRFSSTVSLRTVLVIPFVLQILAAVGLVGYLSFRTGQQSINDLVNDLLDEKSDRISQTISFYLDTPLAITQTNADLIQTGLLSVSDEQSMERHFWNQVAQFPNISYVGIGTEKPGYAGIYRNPNGLIQIDVLNNGTLETWNSDSQGNRTQLVDRALDYDPRKRPWYLDAVAAKDTVWTGIYVQAISNELAVSVVKPLYSRDGELLGVLSNDFLLTQINRFLRELKIGHSGQAFIIDSQGLLVSTSTGEPLARQAASTEEAEQFPAIESRDPVTKAATTYITQNVDRLADIRDRQRFSVSMQEERHYVQVLPLKDVQGLDWLIVAIIPESDFMAEINQSIRNTILLCVLALIIALVLGILTVRWITRPILQLNAAAKDIAQGNWNDTVKVERSDEVGELAESFNNMAAQLQKSFKSLETKNAELQHLSKLKDEFLANTSHELRTPLNGMIGIAESMIDGATGTLTELQERNLWMIAQSGHRLANLVNDILDFSKLKHKGIELQLKPISLREVVEVVLTLNRPLIGTKSLQLVNAVPSDLPAVEADENRLQQILHNLIGNAVKFTPSGTVKVSAELMQSEPKQQLAITVSDTGIGIPSDKLDRIFEAFEQGEGSMTREYGGTGLGLAVTKQLVELHRGELSVRSTVGAGSQFTFTLPTSEQEGHVPKVSPSLARRSLEGVESFESVSISAIAPSTASQASGAVILIVDDEPVNLQVLVNHLSLYDYSIVQASNGEKALELIDEGLRPAIILLDVMMPRMTGYEVTQRLRERHPATELPIVLLTAKTQVSDLVTGLSIGANDYLSKPISRDELLARIRTHLNLSQLREALRIEESKYRIMFENAIEGIFQSSPQGKFLRVNSAFASLFGYQSPDQMLEDIQEISQQLYVDGNKRDEFKQLLTEQGEIRDFEFEAYRRDRSKIWVSVWARAVKDSQNNLLYYEGNCIDITQRKQEENFLRQQLRELQFEIDHSQRARQVAEISETDYFQQLLAEADNLRYSDD